MVKNLFERMRKLNQNNLAMQRKHFGLVPYGEISPPHFLMEKAKDHTLLFIILFLIGGLFVQAAHGTNNRRLKKNLLDHRHRYLDNSVSVGDFIALKVIYGNNSGHLWSSTNLSHDAAMVLDILIFLSRIGFTFLHDRKHYSLSNLGRPWIFRSHGRLLAYFRFHL